MKRWAQIAFGAMLATAMVAGTSATVMAHGQEGPKREQIEQHLSPEFRAKLEQAGVDLKGMRDTRHELHELREAVRTEAHALRDFVKNAPNEAELKAQVRKDLAPHRDKINALRDANQQARADLKAAMEAQDVAKAKAVYQQMQANQKQMKEALIALQSSIKSELAKLKG